MKHRNKNKYDDYDDYDDDDDEPKSSKQSESNPLMYLITFAVIAIIVVIYLYKTDPKSLPESIKTFIDTNILGALNVFRASSLNKRKIKKIIT